MRRWLLREASVLLFLLLVAVLVAWVRSYRITSWLKIDTVRADRSESESRLYSGSGVMGWARFQRFADDGPGEHRRAGSSRLFFEEPARQRRFAFFEKNSNDLKFCGFLLAGGVDASSQWRMVEVPYWFIAAFACTAIVWFFRRSLPPAPGACPACGYLLIGNTSGVCPECGTPTTAGVTA
jgi:hypothetical protein